MLVLSRRKNEAIMINDDIKLVVVDVRGDKVRIGIEAPPDVKVHREEVWQKISSTSSSSSETPIADEAAAKAG